MHTDNTGCMRTQQEREVAVIAFVSWSAACLEASWKEKQTKSLQTARQSVEYCFLLLLLLLWAEDLVIYFWLYFVCPPIERPRVI